MMTSEEEDIAGVAMPCRNRVAEPSESCADPSQSERDKQSLLPMARAGQKDSQAPH